MSLSALLCSMALVFMSPHAGETSLACISPEAAEAEGMGHAAGWYNGDTDTAFVVEGLGLSYSVDVLWHELAHSWDLRKGTELNGHPSFFSETHTGFSVEEFARLQTLHLGVWPEAEEFPDVIPTAEEWAVMENAGWLMPREDF